MVLDEPSSGLNHKETDDLIAFLRNLIAEDLTLLIIEHDMKVVMDISDWVTVVGRGPQNREGPPEEIYNDRWSLKLIWARKKTNNSTTLEMRNHDSPPTN